MRPARSSRSNSRRGARRSRSYERASRSRDAALRSAPRPAPARPSRSRSRDAALRGAPRPAPARSSWPRSRNAPVRGAPRPAPLRPSRSRSPRPVSARCSGPSRPSRSARCGVRPAATRSSRDQRSLRGASVSSGRWPRWPALREPGFFELLFAYDGSKLRAGLPPCGFLFLGMVMTSWVDMSTWQRRCRRSTLRTRNIGDRGRSHTVTIRGRLPRNRPIGLTNPSARRARCPEPTRQRYRTSTEKEPHAASDRSSSCRRFGSRLPLSSWEAPRCVYLGCSGRQPLPPAPGPP